MAILEQKKVFKSLDYDRSRMDLCTDFYGVFK